MKPKQMNRQMLHFFANHGGGGIREIIQGQKLSAAKSAKSLRTLVTVQ